MNNTITLDDLTTLVNKTLRDEEWKDIDILLGFIPKTSRVEFIEQEGGGEGGSENCYSVIRVDGTFYKVLYNYYSHYGFNTDYAEVRVVQPKEKLITVYE